MYRKLGGILFFLLTICQSILAAEELFAEGQSAYSIVLAGDASLSEQTAAKELQAMLQEISGATLPIVKEPVEKGIYIGWAPQTNVPRPDSADESFTYKTAGNSLYIFGGSERGTCSALRSPSARSGRSI